MNRPRTRMMTLHRLIGLQSIDEAPSAVPVPEPSAEAPSGSVLVEVARSVAWWVWAQGPQDRVDWADDARSLVGSAPEVREQHAGAVLVINVDGLFYALGFGQGFRWIKEEFRDQRFGLRVAIRCLDDTSLHGIVRRRPGQGRVETSRIAGGAPVAWLRPRDLSEIVRRVEGKALPLELTYKPTGKRVNRLQGSSGLRLRLGMDGESLTRDIRTIASVHAQPNPRPELAFVDDVTPVDNENVAGELDTWLDVMLGNASPADIALSVPDSSLDLMDRVRTYRYMVGGASARVPELTLDDLVQGAASEPEGHRLKALRDGTVNMYQHERGGRSLQRTSAIRWLEASISLDDRHYALVDGVWHEFGRDFAVRVRREVAMVLTQSSYDALPAWCPSEDEETYNKRVAAQNPGFICLDRRLAKDDEFHDGRGLEVCDLLGPENELIHVKRAKGSAVLSHLFAQGLVSWQSLDSHRETRQLFRQLVHKHGQGRTLPSDFTPRRIVFAIQLGTGRALSAESLFPFAQAALANAASELRGRVRLDVVDIPVMDQANAA